MSGFLAAIDKLLCSYLGFHETEVTPHVVERRDNQLYVVNTESFKRHSFQTSIAEVDLTLMSEENKKKLGVAAGRVIASDLVISFEEVIIKIDTPDN